MADSKPKAKGGVRTFCSAVNCSNSKRSHPELSFFRFPSDANRSKEWVVLSRRQDLLDKSPEYLHKNCKFCANHFESCMFSNKSKNRLKQWAKPTLFNIPNPPAKVGGKRRLIEKASTPQIKVTSQLGEDNTTEDQSSIPVTTSSLTPTTSFSTSDKTSKRNQRDSPRKKKQRNAKRVQSQKIRRMQAKLSKKPTSSKKISKENALKVALAKLPENLANFVKMQVKLHAQKAKGRRYSPQLKSLALSIYHASGKAYRMLSKLFILPTKASLRRYVSKLPAIPGFSQGTLNIIKSKISHMKEEEKIVTLCMDEISLKTHLFYDIRSDKIIGLEDFGGGFRTNKVATSALVFLVRSITGNWKQPLGYVLVNSACPRDEMERLMKEAIDKLDGIGLKVLVIMSDMGSNFHSLANHLNITPEKPWFIYKDTKYFVMFDPPHLIKCIRNNLMKYSFRFDSYTATWQDIEDFYNKDKLIPIRSAPKLTEKHIHPNNFCKMKVKYATQVLSHTVASGICMYVSVGALPSSAIGTAELLLKFDSLFDCVNSSQLHSAKKLKCALTDKSTHLSFLKEAINFLIKLKIFDGSTEVTNRIKCRKGWLVTINAILLIWEHLKTNHEFRFLLTRRLNTDPIENFFGTVRQQGGNSDNPTPVQFTRAFRKLFFSSFLNSSSGNCDDDLDNLLAQCGTKRKLADVPVLVVSQTPPNTLAIGPTDFNEKKISSNLIKDNAVAYVSGYLAKKCFSKHSCETCKAALVSQELDDNRKLLCYFKAYDSEDATFGGLHAPTICYLEYVQQLEAAFVANFSIFTKSSCVGKHVLAKLKDVAMPCQTCPDFPLEFMLKLFLRMRIYYSLKFANRGFSSCKRKDRKYIKVTHL